jgi:pimeloyl-ACP methyl ester carboxylesterase
MAPDVIDHAMITGTLVRPIAGAWMVGALVAMYMPFRNIDWLVKANMKSLGVPMQYLEQFREDTKQLTVSSFSHVPKENMCFKLPATVSQAQTPTLVMIGQKELAPMRQSAKDIVAALPNAQGRVAPNVGHNWSLEGPELFTCTVQAWIEDQSLPAELLPLATP